MLERNPKRKLKLNTSGLRLSLGVAIAVLITSLVFVATKQQRHTSRQHLLSEQLIRLLPAKAYDNNPAMDSIVLNQKVSPSLTVLSAYHYKQAGVTHGAVLHVVTPLGYSGDIELLVAISKRQRVHGVALIAHTETPGLGDKIESARSDWLTQFTHLDANSLPKAAWSVKKDGGYFDQITGATVTPRAVVNAVSDTITWYSINHDSLQ